ncbi:hypothetical protein VFPBJ_04018 [Purpureocillium lilacinum]|uniref:Uncharacterized protein n=1 Tax=Purpureocillium lilacinum TaxID=33203 RepID=A0A179GU55_PURLI|nr:hypothetical protein VFPBJ_04018 [Purpureocillium lilacinum]
MFLSKSPSGPSSTRTSKQPTGTAGQRGCLPDLAKARLDPTAGRPRAEKVGLSSPLGFASRASLQRRAYSCASSIRSLASNVPTFASTIFSSHRHPTLTLLEAALHASD